MNSGACIKTASSGSTLLKRRSRFPLCPTKEILRQRKNSCVHGLLCLNLSRKCKKLCHGGSGLSEARIKRRINQLGFNIPLLVLSKYFGYCCFLLCHVCCSLYASI